MEIWHSASVGPASPGVSSTPFPKVGCWRRVRNQNPRMSADGSQANHLVVAHQPRKDRQSGRVGRCPARRPQAGTQAPATILGTSNPAPPRASTPAWNALREIWGRPITFTCFHDLADDQRESTSPLTIIFARRLALIHPLLSPGAAVRGEGAWGPSKNFHGDGTILARRDP